VGERAGGYYAFLCAYNRETGHTRGRGGPGESHVATLETRGRTVEGVT
jgi:hypothetical protein